MKKKTREITVDGQVYTWAVKDSGIGTNIVSVWIDNKFLAYTDSFPATAPITTEMIATIIRQFQKGKHAEPFEMFIDEVREHRVLKELILIDNEERKKAGYAPRKNAIIESYVNNEENPRFFAARINIDGMAEFDFPKEDAKGIQRVSSRERIKNMRHPMNIERITFLINGEEVEFVRCQD